MVRGEPWDTYYVRNELLDAFYKPEDNHAKYIKIRAERSSVTGIPPKYKIITKDGFKEKNGNCKFIAGFIRPYWQDFYNKIAFGDG